MIEATYCVTATIIVLMGIMAFGFIIYQRVMFSIVADQVAEEVVMTYKLENVKTCNEVTLSDVEDIGKYRYFGSGLRNASLENAEEMADERLDKTSFAQEDGDMTVELEPFTDDLGRRHYKVTVTQPYKFLLGEMFDGTVFSSFNIGNEMKSTVYVQGVDTLNYFNGVATTNYIFRKLESSVEIFQSITKFLEMANNLADLAGFAYDFASLG